ncbi:MAG: type II 3-dehydroquinate dehydratase [Flavobacteriales bacterium]|jgi:3-dehydroquinate dehydratase-2|uniref:type II 3-dehydroquinate dehydratase n=1 Tax=Blattabacterium sp. (Mastotermes darwiniensis) TaxID=39768 RepID=UPI000231DEF9|nr:type II 3-dehydroquinate dehydratase [Blattabacterium sp. (Mastotermes darwiniensis)]AER40813.1 3-dehydroquinate dehydratase [Blattabacterium sp. (Mastotermes darwiniensis) str. MADAR]MDR1804660.1 type II 3-dehydroquinate dehydratase [Flavobacteriales bacterium]
MILQKKISIINGPNLNLLGKREPELYGTINFIDYLNKLKRKKIFSNMEITYFQSNHEGKIIDILHNIGFQSDGIVLNAGAYTHTSLGIADAIKSISSPVIEVHISNIHSRESFRKKSFLSSVCKGTIFGFGLKSYELGIISFSL